MTPRQRKRLIPSTASLLVVCAIAIVAVAIAIPVAVATPQASVVRKPDGVKASAAAEMRTLSLAELQQACGGVKLRRPLVDKVQVTEVRPAVQPEQALTFRLVGTAHEPGHTMAIFQRPDGTTELAGPGEQFREAGGLVTVKQVEGQKATVEFGGVLHELKVPGTP